MRKIRVIIGKPGLDGHDRGARVVAAACRDAGMEVIYTGLRSTPEAIVATALEESVDVIGLSVLSGAHESIARRILDLLKERGLNVPVVMGGVIPPDDRERLRQIGVAAVYGQEASLADVVAGIQNLAREEAA
ncbi:MAG TPA: cobalamin B12-binding domain-containing protein [Polyangia bacterium]|jgi:methylmalonyl-CoA mutase C-terminal domain/subunit|nr:cobalamin B12-binding domain-containing protein [Polyangia bacterium]